MEIGIALPHFGPYASREAIIRVAQEAEQMGFGSLWVLERMLRPTHPVPWIGGRVAFIDEPYAISYDPIETLTFAAAKTERIKLGTSVIDALFHVPVTLARRLATLDQFSGGRVIAGLGQGSLEDEFKAANIPMKRRGSGLEEVVAAMRAVWGPDPVSFSGRFYTIPESQIGPKPVQAGGPPIVIGGMSSAAIERAARIGDGYNPVGPSFPMLEQNINAFRTAARAAGRDPGELMIVVRLNGQAMGPNRPILTGTVQEMAEDVAQLRRLGVNHAFLDLNYAPMPVDGFLRWMEEVRKAAG
jgi:probable F420-dependent oxidoreductase